MQVGPDDDQEDRGRQHQVDDDAHQGGAVLAREDAPMAGQSPRQDDDERPEGGLRRHRSAVRAASVASAVRRRRGYGSAVPSPNPTTAAARRPGRWSPPRGAGAARTSSRYQHHRELRADRRSAHGGAGGGGRVDQLVLPRRLDARAFAGILDADRGGAFHHRPHLPVPASNLLQHRGARHPLLSSEGVGELTDTMPVRLEPCALVRRVNVVRGEVEFAVCVPPAFDYARAGHRVDLSGDHVARFTPNREPPPSCGRAAPAGGGTGRRVPVPAAAGESARVVRVAADGRRRALVGRVGGARDRRDPRVLARVGQEQATTGGSGARWSSGARLHVQALHVRAHRRHGRGAHLQPARDPRRRPQLGLPLRVAARLRLHGLRLPAPRVQAGRRPISRAGSRTG